MTDQLKLFDTGARPKSSDPATPGLPPALDSARHEMENGLSVRVYMGIREPYWEKDGMPATMWTDTPIDQFEAMRRGPYHTTRPHRARLTDINLTGIEETNESIRGPHDVGFAYFRAMFDRSTEEGAIFFRVLGNTLLYAAVTVSASMVLAFGFAMLVNRAARGIGLARVVLFYPTMLPMVSAATIWLFFFTPDYGLLNSALQLFGYTGPQNWVINRDMARWSLMIVAMWKDAGYLMIFYLAGMQSLPAEIYEAADLDGASWWVKTIRITLPLTPGTSLSRLAVSLVAARCGAMSRVFMAVLLSAGLLAVTTTSSRVPCSAARAAVQKVVDEKARLIAAASG